MAEPELRPRRETLASEEHCRRAFQKVIGWTPPAEGQFLDGPNSPREYFALAGSWKGWRACWEYLETQSK